MTEFPKKAIEAAVQADVDGLEKAHAHYGTSWKNRGGVGAFMMLARKWDRLENHVKRYDFNIFRAIEMDKRAEGIMDDIRDLRRYLLLVESEFSVPQVQKEESPKLCSECDGKGGWWENGVAHTDYWVSCTRCNALALKEDKNSSIIDR